MNIRESMEQREQKMLSPYAALMSLFQRQRAAGGRMRCTDCLSERQGQDPS